MALKEIYDVRGDIDRPDLRPYGLLPCYFADDGVINRGSLGLKDGDVDAGNPSKRFDAHEFIYRRLGRISAGVEDDTGQHWNTFYSPYARFHNPNTDVISGERVTQPVVFDIETKSILDSGVQATVPSRTRKSMVARFNRLFSALEKEHIFYGKPKPKIFTYGWPPAHNENGQATDEVLAQASAQFATLIKNHIYGICPDFAYIHEQDMDHWKTAQVNPNVARYKTYYPRTKIYAFVWELYAHYAPNNLKGQYVGDDRWRYCLETLLDHPQVDGIFLWSPSLRTSNPPNTWNPSASWWVTTRTVLRERGYHNLNS